MDHVLKAVREARPGPRWRALYEQFWPSYERWFLSEGEDRRPGLTAARNKLLRFMPALVPTWRRLVDLAGGDERVARFLALYRPAPYMSGCSQAAWVGDEPVLIRNYDYAPGSWEGTLLYTAWHGKRVIAMGDCLWGALDGINEDGLAVALAFGGRRVVGDGFGIPLVLRYLLEFCSTAAEAERVLRRVPSHMAYNVTVLDAGGHFFTAYLAPDRGPIVHAWPIATNHQEIRDWAAHTRLTASLERESFLAERLADPATSAESLSRAFLEPPLHSRHYRRGFGTLYTAVYRPRQGTVELLWPRTGEETRRERFSFAELIPREIPLRFESDEVAVPAAAFNEDQRRVSTLT